MRRRIWSAIGPVTCESGGQNQQRIDNVAGSTPVAPAPVNGAFEGPETVTGSGAPTHMPVPADANDRSLFCNSLLISKIHPNSLPKRVTEERTDAAVLVFTRPPRSSISCRRFFVTRSSSGLRRRLEIRSETVVSGVGSF